MAEWRPPEASGGERRSFVMLGNREVKFFPAENVPPLPSSLPPFALLPYLSPSFRLLALSSYLPSSLPSTYPGSPTTPLSYVLTGCCGRLAGYICCSADGGAAFGRSSCLCAAGGTGDGAQLK